MNDIRLAKQSANRYLTEDMTMDSDLRIVIVAPNASTRLGGESILPWHYFRLMRQRDLDAHLVTHERNRENLVNLLPGEISYMHFVAEGRFSRFVERVALRLRVPQALKPMTIWLIMSVASTVDFRSEVRRLVREAHGPVVVHEPTPVSPRQPSFMTNLDAPLIVGPLNGGMQYPPGFRSEVRRAERVLHRAVKLVAALANTLIRGKKRAALILVANDRTRLALPWPLRRTRCQHLAENGVDLSQFFENPQLRAGVNNASARYVYIGRLVEWKRVDLLLGAMSNTPDDFRLDIVGDGPLRKILEHQATASNLQKRVFFHGLMTQDECASKLRESTALVLPSVYECGGAVVLEAMASGIPVIAADWGGPQDYVIPEGTGILVSPVNPKALTQGLATAMIRLAADKGLANDMGRAGRERVEEHFDWNRKIDRMLQIYDDVITNSHP